MALVIQSVDWSHIKGRSLTLGSLQYTIHASTCKSVINLISHVTSQQQLLEWFGEYLDSMNSGNKTCSNVQAYQLRTISIYHLRLIIYWFNAGLSWFNAGLSLFNAGLSWFVPHLKPVFSLACSSHRFWQHSKRSRRGRCFPEWVTWCTSNTRTDSNRNKVSIRKQTILESKVYVPSFTFVVVLTVFILSHIPPPHPL